MEASVPEEKTAMAGAGNVADSSEEGRRRRRNLSDVSVRSPRKGRTRQGKKARLVEEGDGDSEVKEAREVFKID